MLGRYDSKRLHLRAETQDLGRDGIGGEVLQMLDQKFDRWVNGGCSGAQSIGDAAIESAIGLLKQETQLHPWVGGLQPLAQRRQGVEAHVLGRGQHAGCGSMPDLVPTVQDAVDGRDADTGAGRKVLYRGSARHHPVPRQTPQSDIRKDEGNEGKNIFMNEGNIP